MRCLGVSGSAALRVHGRMQATCGEAIRHLTAAPRWWVPGQPRAGAAPQRQEPGRRGWSGSSTAPCHDMLLAAMLRLPAIGIAGSYRLSAGHCSTGVCSR